MSRSGVNHRGRPWRGFALLGGLIFACSLFATPKGLQAQTWTGTNSNLWGDAGNWTPGTVPNSSTASAIITNTTNNPVLTNGSFTVANLTLGGATNSLDIQNNRSFTIYADVGGSTISNAGTITLDAAANNTDLILGGAGGTIDLTGGGILQLSNSANNRIYSNASDTFHIATGSTVQGSGQFGIGSNAFVLNNDGTINANQSVALQVRPGALLTNTGTLEATNAGTMNLIATVTNTSGTIKADGASSVVNLTGSAITGGTITTTNGGVVQNNGSATIDSVTISSGSTLTLANNTVTDVKGTITNNGTIAQSAAANNTDLRLNGAVELSGGTLQLSNSANNRIYGVTAADSLKVDSGTIVQGSGQFGIGSNAFTLTNNGTIDANQSTALQVRPGGTITNNSILEATAGGTMNLIASVTNASGTIQADGVGSVVNLASSTITGGTITTTNGGVVQNQISGSATIDSVTISSGSTLTLANNSTTDVKGTITNNGTIAQNAGANNTDLRLNGAVELSGGTLQLSNSANNRIYGVTAADSLKLDSGTTVQGSGQFGIGSNAFALTNNGTIDANQSVALQVRPGGTITNNSILEATAGGTMNLIATVNNSATGIVQADGGGSVVNLSGSTITGGTITTTNGGVVQNQISGSATIDSVTISSGSTLTLANNSTTDVKGTITNNGTIAQNAGANNTNLRLNGTVELSGGILQLSNSSTNRIYGNTGADSLKVDSGTTVQGSGQFGIGSNAFTLTNNGTIDANQSTALQVKPGGTLTNNSVLEATAGGTMNLIASVTNASGTIQADGVGSVVNLSGSTITGGTITTTNGGVVQNQISGSATIDSVTISSDSTLTLANNSSTVFKGTITNNGTIAQNAGANNTDLRLNGAVELSGGILQLSNSANNRIYGNTGADSLKVDSGTTVQGSGQFGIGSSAFTLTNDGTIDANQSVALQVKPGAALTNNSVLEATSGGTMNLIATVNNSATGMIKADGGSSVVNLSGSTITGGTITTTNGGVVQNQISGSATIDSVTISTGSTLTLANNSTTDVKGTITNNGTIAQNAGANNTDLRINGTVELAGTGVLALSNSANNRVYGVGSAMLTNDVNHTIQGSGQFGIGSSAFTFVNNGNVIANQSNAFNVFPGGNTTNNGTFQANSGSLLFMNGTLTNYNPTTSTLTGGTYKAFSGTIELSTANNGTGKVIATNAATILLDGASAKIADGTGADVVRGHLSSNAAAGSFTIQNGANVTSASSGFTNAGTVNIGANSTFTVGGANDYMQTGGLTVLTNSSSLLAVAMGHSVNINGGTLEGFGTIQGNLANAGTVHPGGSPGILTVTGDYSQTNGGTFGVDIAGALAGTGFSQLNASGSAAINGILDLQLISGFVPADGEIFVILTSSALSGMFSTVNGQTQNGVTFDVEYSPFGFANDVVLVAHVNAVPEPASCLMLGLGAVCVGAYFRKRRKTSDALNV